MPNDTLRDVLQKWWEKRQVAARKASASAPGKGSAKEVEAKGKGKNEEESEEEEEEDEELLSNFDPSCLDRFAPFLFDISNSPQAKNSLIWRCVQQFFFLFISMVNLHGFSFSGHLTGPQVGASRATANLPPPRLCSPSEQRRAQRHAAIVAPRAANRQGGARAKAYGPTSASR